MQWSRFQEVARRFPNVPWPSTTAAALSFARHFDLVRAGIALYGGAPHDGANPMCPVIALEAPLRNCAAFRQARGWAMA
jgi:alanine racemase